MDKFWRDIAEVIGFKCPAVITPQVARRIARAACDLRDGNERMRAEIRRLSDMVSANG